MGNVPAESLVPHRRRVKEPTARRLINRLGAGTVMPLAVISARIGRVTAAPRSSGANSWPTVN